MPETLIAELGLPIQENLHKVFFCSQCNRNLVQGVVFTTDGSIRTWGDATVSHHGHIDRNEDDSESQVDDVIYKCSECDNIVTDEIEQISNIIDYIHTKVSASPELSDKVRNTYDRLVRTANGESMDYRVYGVLGRYILKVVTVNTETVCFNPELLQILSECTIMNEDERIEIDIENNLYQWLKQISSDTTTIVTTNTAQSSPRVRPITITEVEDRDPLNGNIVQNQQHSRWRNENTKDFIECFKCQHIFEADEELDDVTCPKCNHVNKQNADNNKTYFN